MRQKIVIIVTSEEDLLPKVQAFVQTFDHVAHVQLLRNGVDVWEPDPEMRRKPLPRPGSTLLK